MKDACRLNKLCRKNRKIEKRLSKVSVSETEAENLCEDSNIVKKYQSTLGIKPRTSVFVGEHSTTTTACYTQW